MAKIWLWPHSDSVCVCSPKVNLKKKNHRNMQGLSLFSGTWVKQAKHFIIFNVKLLSWVDVKACLPQPAIRARGPRHLCAVWWNPQNLKLDLTYKSSWLCFHLVLDTWSSWIQVSTGRCRSVYLNDNHGNKMLSIMSHAFENLGLQGGASFR